MVLIFILKYLSDFHCKTGRAVNVCWWSQHTLSSKVTKIEKSPYLAGWPAAWSLEGIMLPAHTVCWHVIPLDPKSTWPIYIYGKGKPGIDWRSPTWLRWTPVLGPNAERARRGPQTRLVNVVQPRGAYLRQEINLPHKVILTAMLWKCK